ncbi:hypothetical protein OIU78_000150 [Salix suchowensis]|nr:hypothetical protein OIU78_000150 [Salix suchowensis]
MGPTFSLVLDSTNSAIDSAIREKPPWSITSESCRFLTLGPTRRMWGRELTPKREKDFWDSLNSMSQKKREEAADTSLLAMKEEETREYWV